MHFTNQSPTKDKLPFTILLFWALTRGLLPHLSGTPIAQNAPFEKKKLDSLN